MNRTKKLVTLFSIIAVVVLIDQITKQIAIRYLLGREPLIFLNDTARLLYAENTGAFLSLGARLPETTQRWVFLGLVTVILLALLVYTLKELRTLNRMLIVGFGLILGGGIGNLIDRIVNDGRVVDFMNVGIGRLRTGIFNVADMALMAGVGVVLVFALLHHEEAPEYAEKPGIDERQ